MPEDITAAADKAPKKSVKKAAAKKATVAAPAKPKTPRKKAKARLEAYQINDKPISAVYKDPKVMLDDIALEAKADDTVTIWRAGRTGKLKTKVRIG